MPIKTSALVFEMRVHLGLSQYFQPQYLLLLLLFDFLKTAPNNE